MLGGLALPRARLVAEVGGVDPDQVTADLGDLGGRVVRRGLVRRGHTTHGAPLRATRNVRAGGASPCAGTSGAARTSARSRSVLTTPSCSTSACGRVLVVSHDLACCQLSSKTWISSTAVPGRGPLHGALAPGTGGGHVGPAPLDHDFLVAVVLGHAHLQASERGGADRDPRGSRHLRFLHVSRLGRRASRTHDPRRGGDHTCLARMDYVRPAQVWKPELPGRTTS